MSGDKQKRPREAGAFGTASNGGRGYAADVASVSAPDLGYTLTR